MVYTALDIAKYMITYSYKKQSPISNLKLQKLLFFIWVDFFKKTGRALFADEFCAWQLGPVVPNVYYSFCAYAGLPITQEFPNSISSQDAFIIDQIIESYLCYSAGNLVQKSHQKGHSWDKVYKDGLGNRDVIPFPLIINTECVE